MIGREEILQQLSKYDVDKISIATICSHSALQIFYGARQEGFKTIGICLRDRVRYYEAFPEASPDDFIIVDRYEDVLDDGVQKRLLDSNAIIVAHGSFVEYVGAENLQESFYVPMYGNRKVLEWESDRRKQLKWFKVAGVKFPKVYDDPSQIDSYAFVKVYGARGGKGYFRVRGANDFCEKLKTRVEEGAIRSDDQIFIQEFVAGSRYYPHYFYTQIGSRGLRLSVGGLELLSMDRRIEPIDEIYRGLPDIVPDYLDYTVSGNQPVIVRESLLPDLLDIGSRLVEASMELFPPGLLGPFCVETIYNSKKGFVVFEVSARIVAGTNLYPEGSPYTSYLFKERMSTGRRISLDIKEAIVKNRLHDLFY
ncbi:MAG: formate--phosphoribosylaminoimidazolecarboxamide ligase [Nitrososphaeria archaeon]